MDLALTSQAFENFQAALLQVARSTDETLAWLIGHNHTSGLVAAMRYAALGAGKRLRPFLVMESAGLFAVPPSQALRVAAAVECVHCYSLVHDDLPAMDDDDLRRGKLTVHRQFDEATAILVGDALQTLAFETLSQPETHADGNIRCELVMALAQAAGKDGMVKGQMLDIEAEACQDAELEHITRIQSLKTGALFRFSCEAGAILAGEDRSALRQYADDIGLAFQITDDLLDVESTPETLGKATQKDQALGKATFVDLLGIGGARKEAQRLVERAVAAVSVYGDKAELLQAAARFIVSRTK